MVSSRQERELLGILYNESTVTKTATTRLAAQCLAFQEDVFSFYRVWGLGSI